MRRSSENPDLELFAVWLRSEREKRKLDVEQVAKKIGVSQACYYEWERGRSYPVRNKIVDVARVFRTTESSIISRIDFSKRARISNIALNCVEVTASDLTLLLPTLETCGPMPLRWFVDTILALRQREVEAHADAAKQ